MFTSSSSSSKFKIWQQSKDKSLLQKMKMQHLKLHVLLILVFVALIIHDSQSQSTVTSTEHKHEHEHDPLRPSDLLEPTIYQAYQNTTISIDHGIHDTDDTMSTGTDTTGKTSTGSSSIIQKVVAQGRVTQINKLHNQNENDNDYSNSIDADISVIQSAVDQHDIDDVVALLRAYNDENYDQDPDTVDGMPTYELFLDNEDIRRGVASVVSHHSTAAESTTIQNDGSIVNNDNNNNKESNIDTDWAKNTMKPQNSNPNRIELRQKIKNILDPYLHKVITPYVQKMYPDKCGKSKEGNNRTCTPCYSLIRRYKHGNRKSHATHHDAHSLVTVVVSLSDYGKDYLGGLYVSTGFGQREVIGLLKGDAVMHTSALLHGVKVHDLKPPHDPTTTERFSWILWYRDSDTCEDYSYEWFADCANNGNPICQQLHSTKVGNVPGIKTQDISKHILQLNMEAAKGGAAESAVKIARAYLKLLPSTLEYNEEEAKTFYNIAIQSFNPEGHYGLAHLILLSINKDNEALYNLSTSEEDRKERDRLKEKQQEKLKEVIQHLEAAAKLGHEFSMFNLGIAHVFGYGLSRINVDLAASWFIESGLPEGYFVAAQQAASVGDEKRYKDHMEKAKTLGYFAFWRKEARMRTGSGGAAGVDLNLPWPEAIDGRKPPLF